MLYADSKCQTHYNYFNGGNKMVIQNGNILMNLTDGKIIGSKYNLELIKRPTQSNMVTCKLTWKEKISIHHINDDLLQMMTN